MDHEHDQNPPTGELTADDIAHLRERLEFYESFDRLIQDNISRAGELLREAANRKSESELALRTSTAEIEKRQLEERMNYRRIFSALLDDVTTVQQNVERLARQVADALDDLEAVIPAQGELSSDDAGTYPTMPTFSSGIAGELATGATAGGYDEESGSGLIANPADIELGVPEPSEAMEPVDEVVTADEAIQESTDFGTTPSATSTFGSAPGFQSIVQASVERVSAEMGAGEATAERAEPVGVTVDISAEDGTYTIEPFDQDPFGVEGSGRADESGREGQAPGAAAAHEAEHPATANERAGAETSTHGQPQGEPDVDETWTDDGPGAATTVLVHGVPRATTALSLKRYLEGLEQVHTVEPREYAEGVLRLQVSSDRPVGMTDLLGWPEAEGMEPVEVREDFVEVRLGQ